MSQYNRRSTRAISSVPNQYGTYQGGQGNRPGLKEEPVSPKPQLPQTQFVPQQQPPVPKTAVEEGPYTWKTLYKAIPDIPPPPPAPPAFVPELPKDPLTVSATTKALDAMEEEGDDTKPRWQKGRRLSKAEKRKRLNNMISKVVAPKSALMLLHEFRPNVSYRFTESASVPNPSYLAEVLVDSNVIAIGQGTSKAVAKHAAAENALKAIVGQMVKDGHALPKKQESQNSASDGSTAEGETKMEEDVEQLPWTGLAAYAMYRMFNEWQQEGVQVPLPANDQPSFRRPVNTGMPGETGLQASATPAAQIPRKGKPKDASELPAAAASMHPTALITQMRPDAVFSEVSRIPGPEGGVTVSVQVEGQLFQASARNRKDARKEASKLVAKALYGIQYAA